MQLSEDYLHTLVYTGFAVDLWSIKMNLSLTVSSTDRNSLKIEREDFTSNEKVTTEIYSSFRNGDKDSPDLEQFCEGWKELMNAEDCYFNLKDLSKEE